MGQALHDLWYGFGVALQPDNLMWSRVRRAGRQPDRRAARAWAPLSTISMLLPLTYVIAPVPAILMLAGIFYGSQYGGAIGAILLNLPSHPPHAVTCLDGYPMTLQGKGGTALGITMMASFFAASVGIVVMIFLSPLLVRAAYSFGPADICAIMLLGLLAGATMARGSPLKGVAMTVFGLLCGAVGTDVISGTARYTLRRHRAARRHRAGRPDDGPVRHRRLPGQRQPHDDQPGARPGAHARHAAEPGRDEAGVLADAARHRRRHAVRRAARHRPDDHHLHRLRARAQDRARTPERFGKGALEGVAAPEAASHSKTQVDFIPTMSLGIPGDAVMALILGALIIKGIQPGPQLITEHPDIFWGLIASFWIGNVLLVILNVPLIGVWVRLLQVPYRFLFPSALFFIARGRLQHPQQPVRRRSRWPSSASSARSSWRSSSRCRPSCWASCSGRCWRRTSGARCCCRAATSVFVTRPVAAGFIGASALLVLAQLYSYARRARRPAAAAPPPAEELLAE